MEDRDSGQRTTALAFALWRAPWIWRWFVQTAIVRFRGTRPLGAQHLHLPALCTHVDGRGRPVFVWWWDHG